MLEYELRGTLGTGIERDTLRGSEIWIYGNDGVDENVTKLLDELRGNDVRIVIEVA